MAEGRIHADGLLLLADDPDRQREKILWLWNDRGMPMVLFDVDMHRGAAGLDFPPFVGGNEELGGHLAAQMLACHLKDAGVEQPVVLVLKGASTAWESLRSQSFSSELRNALPNSVIIESEDLQYDRLRARDASLRCFSTMRRDGTVDVDAIFACNDDMALGARSGIIRAWRGGASFRDHLRIVGYDGVKEMRDYIDNHDRWILGTVDVKLEEQIGLALEMLQRMIETGIRESRKILVTPVVYKG